MLCAQKRGDAVPKLYRDIVSGKSNNDKKAIFFGMKRATNLTWAFVGLPNCIPACLGLINELRRDNIAVPSEVDRFVTEFASTNQALNLRLTRVVISAPFNEVDWSTKGKETNRQIYRAVGNSEVGQMIAQYFPELCTRPTHGFDPFTSLTDKY